ncbi:hypothetical protein AVEN_135999-1 [Araneus ventricosus]|uniref:Uncharacterized protein n=1 Tax=Araneus ventricosus TaxID=182803 RepID=A0A4Y2QCQ9_ARAVE|nr:hypothetical protein AVEN_135999-1 [Araneus ventricosus]
MQICSKSRVIKRQAYETCGASSGLKSTRRSLCRLTSSQWGVHVWSDNRPAPASPARVIKCSGWRGGSCRWMEVPHICFTMQFGKSALGGTVSHLHGKLLTNS